MRVRGEGEPAKQEEELRQDVETIVRRLLTQDAINKMSRTRLTALLETECTRTLSLNMRDPKKQDVLYAAMQRAHLSAQSHCLTNAWHAVCIQVRRDLRYSFRAPTRIFFCRWRSAHQEACSFGFHSAIGHIDCIVSFSLFHLHSEVIECRRADCCCTDVDCACYTKTKRDWLGLRSVHATKRTGTRSLVRGVRRAPHERTVR